MAGLATDVGDDASAPAAPELLKPDPTKAAALSATMTSMTPAYLMIPFLSLGNESSGLQVSPGLQRDSWWVLAAPRKFSRVARWLQAPTRRC